MFEQLDGSSYTVAMIDARNVTHRPSDKGLGKSIRPEVELLLGCLHTGMDTVTASRIRTLLQEDIDWTYLMQVANRHGVMPLLYWTLKATCPEAVPSVVLDQLRTHFHINACHNFLFTHELLTLLHLFAAHGIPAIPYKGPALAEYAYGNLALRQFTDLDILMRKQDVLKAKELVLSQGYRPECQLTPVQEAVFIQAQCEYNFDLENPRVHLELHWRIVPRFFSFPLDLEPVWKHLKSVSLAGTSVASLPPEELLLSLCVHGSKHCWVRLQSIVDIAELIRAQPAMDWQRLIELTQKLGSERLLCLGLLLVHDLLETVFPDEVSRRIQADPAIQTLAEQVRRRLFQRTNDSPPDLFSRARFHLQTRERLRDRIRYCLRFIMTPTVGDWKYVSLPDALNFFYYLLRPLRLGIKYGLRPLTSRLGF